MQRKRIKGCPKNHCYWDTLFLSSFQHLAIKRLFFFLMGLFLSYRSDAMSYFLDNFAWLRNDSALKNATGQKCGFIFYLLPKYAPSFASPHYNFCLLGA
jgi:hypothetical protein